MKRTYQVEIMGQKFSIKSDENQSHVNQVVHYINEKMKKIVRTQKVMSINDISVLTLLNVADELFKYKEEKELYRNKVIERTRNILKMIET